MLEIPALRGRTFEPQDQAPNAPVRAVITAPLARRLFGEGDPIGGTLLVGRDLEAAIVGVVGDLRTVGPAVEPPLAMFLSDPTRGDYVSALLRPRTFDGATAKQIQEAFASVYPDLPAPEPVLLTDRIYRQLAPQRLLSRLLGLVAILAVSLVAVGLYGVQAFAVISRRRELGVRIALGATATRIIRLVVSSAATTIGVSLLLGFGAAHLMSRILESQLFGVATTDPLSYAIAAIFFAAVALIGIWKPLRLAMHVDPVIALKEG
jgi:putative ABC transport system permease protein